MPFQRILIAIDESELTARTVAIGADLATALHAQLALVHVLDTSLAGAPEGGMSAEATLADLQQAGQALLQAARGQVPASVPVTAFSREGKPAEEVVAAAQEWPADLIIIGTHGRAGLQRLLIGSTADAVVRQAPCPVLTVKATPEEEHGAA
jgi:nucleotide-binding universal stress UspA family protein